MIGREETGTMATERETFKMVLGNIDAIQRETIAELVMITAALIDGSHPVYATEANEPRQEPTMLDSLRASRDNSEAILKMIIRIREYLW